MHTLDLMLIPTCALRRIMKELVEAIAKALVDNPDQVQVRAVEGAQVIVYELRVHQSDVGQVIGHHGRIANAIRTILSAAGMKQRKRLTLEILD
jgi:predicted RNA-binding protein YlqC (UPF0109 family)